jgi:hypothetical protein
MQIVTYIDLSLSEFVTLTHVIRHVCSRAVMSLHAQLCTRAEGQNI